MTLEVNQPAPHFSLPRDGGETVSLSDYKGKKVVVYFYPKDNTSGCTTEACNFRDNMNRLLAANTIVLGISKDSVKSHEGFIQGQNLNFPLLSDMEGKVCDLFGVWIEKSMYGRKYMGIERATFLIDEKGIIRRIWRNVKVPGHVDEVLKAIEEVN